MPVRWCFGIGNPCLSCASSSYFFVLSTHHLLPGLGLVFSWSKRPTKQISSSSNLTVENISAVAFQILCNCAKGHYSGYHCCLATTCDGLRCCSIYPVLCMQATFYNRQAVKIDIVVQAVSVWYLLIQECYCTLLIAAVRVQLPFSFLTGFS